MHVLLRLSDIDNRMYNAPEDAYIYKCQTKSIVKPQHSSLQAASRVLSSLAVLVLGILSRSRSLLTPDMSGHRLHYSRPTLTHLAMWLPHLKRWKA